MTKEENKFPPEFDSVVKEIKEELKDNPNVPEDNVKGYNRRVLGDGRGPNHFLMTHINIIYKKHQEITKLEEEKQELKEEKQGLLKYKIYHDDEEKRKQDIYGSNLMSD